MENSFDKISAKLSDEELNERLDNPGSYQYHAVISAGNELLKRNDRPEIRNKIDEYKKFQKQKADLRDKEKQQRIKIIQDFESELKGKLANPWERLFAYLLDSLFVLISLVLTYVLFRAIAAIDLFMRYYEIFTGIANITVPIIYFIGFEISVFQATPGKLIFRLQVVNRQGKRIGILLALARYFCKIISWLIFGLGYIMILTDLRSRALHDRITNVYVVKRMNRLPVEPDNSELLDYEIN